MENSATHKSRPLAKKIIDNTAFNALGKFWGIILGIFLTPYIIHSIGVERYGVWAVVGSVTGYFGLLDFGIGTSYVKYIAEFYTKRDYENINRVVNSGLLFYLIFTCFLVAAAYLFFPTILLLLKIPEEFRAETVFVFWTGLLTFCISNAASVFAAVQNGLQRMAVYNKISVAVSIPTTCAIILVLRYGYGLRGLIMVNACAMLLGGIANWFFAYRLLPELEISPRYLSAKTFSLLFNYGSKLQIARVCSAISMQIDKILLTRYLDLGSVTLFQLGASIIEQTKSLPLLLMNALLPAFSELDARGDREKLVEVYIRGTKYIALVTIPLFILLAISADSIILAWMGPGYGRSALIIRILSIGWGIAVISGVRATVLQAIGKPGIEMQTGLVAGVLNIPLSWIFLKELGFPGVAVGTSLALTASAIYGFERLNRELKIKTGFYIMTYIPQLTLMCAVSGLAVFGLAEVAWKYIPENRATALLACLSEGLTFSALYLLSAAMLKPLDKRDISFLAYGIPDKLKWAVKYFTREHKDEFEDNRGI